MFAKFEWIIIELVVLAALLWELASIRRAVKRDRAAAKAARESQPKP